METRSMRESANVWFLLTPLSSYITGHVLVLDGPELTRQDRIMGKHFRVFGDLVVTDENGNEHHPAGRQAQILAVLLSPRTRASCWPAQGPCDQAMCKAWCRCR